MLLSKDMTCARSRCMNVFFTLHTALFRARTSHYTLHTPHFISSHLKSSDFFSPHVTSSQLSFHLMQSLFQCHLSKFFSTSQLFSPHPSTEKSSSQLNSGLLHARNDLLCTLKLAQSTSQYYFVLQSLHIVRPSSTSYYKACAKYFPVPLCTTKHARSTSQLYFVLQSLHKAFPSTTLYYNA